ncbi:hypothetical protein VNO80_17560 [Phaseolus coccineus]|uniref:Uncharacterized protein n=1 Tax=Phaseolus coccineus TaxID=3886 RepID=A0AAN9QY13_PHACN
MLQPCKLIILHSRGHIVMLTKLCLSRSRWRRKLECAGCFSIWTFTLVYLYLILPVLWKSGSSIESMGAGIGF